MPPCWRPVGPLVHGAAWRRAAVPQRRGLGYRAVPGRGGQREAQGAQRPARLPPRAARARIRPIPHRTGAAIRARRWPDRIGIAHTPLRRSRRSTLPGRRRAESDRSCHRAARAKDRGASISHRGAYGDADSGRRAAVCLLVIPIGQDQRAAWSGGISGGHIWLRKRRREAEESLCVAVRAPGKRSNPG
jgi:hypothetical protein